MNAIGNGLAHYVKDDDPKEEGLSSAHWGSPRWAVLCDGTPVAHAYSKKGADLIALAYTAHDEMGNPEMDNGAVEITVRDIPTPYAAPCDSCEVEVVAGDNCGEYTEWLCPDCYLDAEENRSE